MVRFLVEHGACILATTLSDHETPAEKCEQDEEGYDGCSQYLYSQYQDSSYQSSFLQAFFNIFVTVKLCYHNSLLVCCSHTLLIIPILFFCAGVQEKLGIMNGGLVYAVYDYESEAGDELSFQCGDELTILRRGDEYEREWWWGQLNDAQGYIPRNLLGVSLDVCVLSCLS